MRWFVDICHFIAAVAISPFILYQAITTGKYRRDWDQRMGRMPTLPPAEGSRVWVHAVSVGEVNAVRGLVTAWRTRYPQTQFVISTTTDTGMTRARELFPDLTVIRYPLDFSRFVSRALDRIAPTMIVLVELEIWFHFVTTAKRRGIPVAIVNGRLSKRSRQRFGWIKPIARRMFGSLTWVGAQDEAIAQRFRQLGASAERVNVTGSLKWDTAEVTDKIAGSESLARAMGIATDRPVWVCGSTGPGEEDVILKAYSSLRPKFPDLQLVLVPRKPERFDEVAAAIKKHGLACIRRSESPDGDERTPVTESVQLIDTMGELRKAYSLADVVFVGRTLADMGGSDMMEVAGLGKPIIVGPHTENFADIMQKFRASNAICLVDAELNDVQAADRLVICVSRLLERREEARQMADRGCEVVKRNRGATERTLEQLMAIM
jgi:3-deoxy-D-manno-octulosonic-acid transferase